jgi:Electron transfer flavoprotein, alpha subunit
MNNYSNEVFVFIEQRGGNPADVSFELLCKGRKLADSMNGPLKAIVIGHDVKNIAAETFKYGANEAIVVDHPDLKNFLSSPYTRIMNQIVGDLKPRIVLFGATIIGRDLAPRVASNTKSGLTADCTDLQIADIIYLKEEFKSLLLQIRPAFGGNIIATIITPDNPTQMATVREGVMEMIPVKNPSEVKITEIQYTPNEIDKLIEIAVNSPYIREEVRSELLFCKKINNLKAIECISYLCIGNLREALICLEKIEKTDVKLIYNVYIDYILGEKIILGKLNSIVNKEQESPLFRFLYKVLRMQETLMRL